MIRSLAWVKTLLRLPRGRRRQSALVKAPGGRHQGGERSLIAALLGMPLHSQHEERARSSTASMTPSGGTRRDDQAGAQCVDRLVVRAEHGRLGSEDLRRPGARHGGHLHLTEHRRGASMVLVADHVGQVLVQRAAQLDVENLTAAAHGQHGKVDRQGRRQERRARLSSRTGSTPPTLGSAASP